MTFDAIEAVCGEPFGYDGIDVLDAVTALVEKSLLRALPVDDADPEPRYDMLVSVREYAAERLAASGATAEVVRRHAMFYADVNMLDSDSVEDGAAVVQRVGRELHNMRAACDWAQREGTSEDELRFSTFLLILVDAGHFDEAKERALHALARHRAPAPGRVRMLAVLSYLYWHTAEPDKERQAIEDQLAEARELGDASLLASALLDDVQNIVDRDELLARVDEIDALISSIPPGRTEAPVWYLLELRDNRISIALRYADPDRALEFARSYYETTHFDQFVGGSLLASLYVDRGDWEAAETTLREIEKYAGVTWSGDRLNDAEATHSLLQPMWARTLALVALGRGDVAAATGYAENALRRVQPLGMQHWISRSHATLAACHAAAGRVDEARAELLSAREGYEGDNAQLGMVEWRLARVARLAGDLDEARRRVDTARALVAGQELTMLTDVLAAVLEEAHLAIDTDPEQAARLVARVARDRGSFVLPMGASEDVEPLLTALCSRLGGERLAEIVAEVAARPPWST
jgi:ATP/maltotriose-dependent transcriptional regulator MalT